MTATASALPAGPAPATPRRGHLYLVPTPLDHGCAEPVALDAVLPRQTIETAARIDHWICENARSARAYLKRVSAACPLAVPLQAQNLAELPRHAHKHGDHTGSGGANYDAQQLLAPALRGHDMGLLSEAGMPAIADPGSGVVRAAHRLGIEVIPLVGPVSLLLALAASGLNGQRFAFVGYLPQAAQSRMTRIRALEARALETGETQIFIETPYRNRALLQALIDTLGRKTMLSVAWGLTLAQARVISQPVAAWRGRTETNDPEVPAIFAIGP